MISTTEIDSVDIHPTVSGPLVHFSVYLSCLEAW